MMQAEILKTLEDSHTSGFYNKRDIMLVEGKGAKVYSASGKEYIDCVAGQGVALLGHGNPRVASAVTDQARKIITCPEMFYNDKRAQFLNKLAEITPDGIERFFLCNSGTEAVEAAIKIARISTGKKGIIAMKHGFHGRSLGALSATWQPKYREPVEPLVPGFTHINYNDAEALKKAIDDDTAAVIIEVIQGEGGINIADYDYIKNISGVCKEKDVLLILDEIQTGFGRTGKYFAFEHYDIKPDLICMAKGIAGGIPMGVTAIGDKVGELPKRTHGSTFGGNPLACAAGLASLGYIEENNLLARSQELGDYFLEKLRGMESDIVKDVRGKGLMIGVQLKQRVGPYLQALQDNGVLAFAAGTLVIRFLPPLVIEKEEIDFVMDVTKMVLKQ